MDVSELKVDPGEVERLWDLTEVERAVLQSRVN